MYDGVCNLCNSAVQFVLKRDKHDRFMYASLQSEAGQYLIRQYGLSDRQLNTFIYIDHEGYEIQSSAALRVLYGFGGTWRVLATVGGIVPRFVRDFIYRFVARNRYRWFGQQDTCMLPSANVQRKFVASIDDLKQCTDIIEAPTIHS
nr:thiol-disulfide oxidoreductase DCC family protein [Caldalkalibacillus salinus]